MSFIFLIIFLIDQYIQPQDWVAFMLNFPVDYIIIPLTIIFGIIEIRHRNDKMPVFLPQYLFMVVLLVCIYLSDVLHGDYQLANDEFILFFKKMMIFFMILIVVNTPKRLKNFLTAILILSLVLVIQGIYQYTHGVGWAGQLPYWGDEGRITWIGFWNGSNILALGFVIALPIAFYFALELKNISYKVLGYSSILLLCYGIFLCNSRGGIIATGFVLIVFFIFKNGAKKGLIAGSVLILGIIPFLPSRAGMMNTQDESAHTRVRLWREGFNMLWDNPILGVGKGKFTEFSVLHLRAHNNYVQNMADLGIVGFFFWLGLIYLSYKGLYIISKSLSKSNIEVRNNLVPIYRTLILMLCGFCISTMFITSEIEPFYILLGLVGALQNIVKKSSDKILYDFTYRDGLSILFLEFSWIILIYLYAVRELFR